jgi:hypothetical protein
MKRITLHTLIRPIRQASKMGGSVPSRLSGSAQQLRQNDATA